MNPTPLGEIVESSTTLLVAQCPAPRLYEPPLFGSLIKTPPSLGLLSAKTEDDPFLLSHERAEALDWVEGTTYAVVWMAHTGSLDTTRRPAAFGMEEAQLRAEQPQIFDLLHTEFRALPLASVEQGKLRITLPARPPRLHAFLGECSPEEVCALSEYPDVLRAILRASLEVSTDALLVAFIRQAWRAREQDFDYLVRTGKTLATLLSGEPERLSSILRLLEP